MMYSTSQYGSVCAIMMLMRRLGIQYAPLPLEFTKEMYDYAFRQGCKALDKRWKREHSGYQKI